MAEYLTISHLQKQFGDVQVLKDISLTVNQGKSFPLLGASGSGKSTLLRCATFLETLSSGEIAYMGETAVTAALNAKPVYAPKKQFRKIQTYFGLVFQNFNLFPHYSVLKNIVEPQCILLKRSKKEATENAMKLLKKLVWKKKRPLIHVNCPADNNSELRLYGHWRCHQQFYFLMNRLLL